MTQYLNKSFSVTMPTGQQYRDNWDAVFGKKELSWQDITCENQSMYDCGGWDVCDRMFRHTRTESSD